MPHVVNQPKRNGKRAGNPSICRIFGIHISLNNLFSLAEVIVHFTQKFRMHQIIRIENDKGVVLFFLRQHLRKHPIQRIAFTDFFRVGSDFDNRPVLPTYFSRMVSTVVRYDIHVIHVFGIVQFFEIVNQLPDDSFFIMCTNNSCKGVFRRSSYFFSSLDKAKHSQYKVIQCIKNNDYLNGYHDDIQYMFHT